MTEYDFVVQQMTKINARVLQKLRCGIKQIHITACSSFLHGFEEQSAPEESNKIVRSRLFDPFHRCRIKQTDSHHHMFLLFYMGVRKNQINL